MTEIVLMLCIIINILDITKIANKYMKLFVSKVSFNIRFIIVI